MDLNIWLQADLFIRDQGRQFHFRSDGNWHAGLYTI